jgi:hypothetical protein
MSHWVWAHFVTDGNFFQNNRSNKNAWCTKCLAHHRDLLLSADAAAVAATGINDARTPDQIEALGVSFVLLEVLSDLSIRSARINCPPMAGKPKQNMVPHLSKCTYVDPATKALALEARTEPVDGFVLQQHPQRPSQPLRPILTTWSNMPSISATPSPLPSPLLLSTSLCMQPALKRRRTLSLFEDPPPSGRPTWTPAMQAEFGEDICKLLIAIRSPWNSANNPQMHLFFDKWMPGAVVPDRRTLSGPILDREAAKVEEKLKMKLRGRLATYTTDGWKNKAKQSIVASMVSVASEVRY